MIFTYNLKMAACLDLKIAGYGVGEIAKVTGLMEETVRRHIKSEIEFRETRRLMDMGWRLRGRVDKALRLLRPASISDAYLRAEELRKVRGIGNKTINDIRYEAIKLMGIDRLEDDWELQVEEWIRENPPPMSREQLMRDLEPGLNALFGDDIEKYEDKWKHLYEDETQH